MRQGMLLKDFVEMSLDSIKCQQASMASSVHMAVRQALWEQKEQRNDLTLRGQM